MKHPLLHSLICALLTTALAVAQSPSLEKTEHFDRDPGWEAHANRTELKPGSLVQQDFGYSPTNHAGSAAGEIGGRLTRASRPSSYAAEIPPHTLDQKFSASGSFAITESHPSAGMFFGFVQSKQPGSSGRPIGSLGLDFDFENSGGRLAVRLITAKNQSCGTFITPYLPGKYRTTPLKKDGTRYHWTLAYDPAAAEGRGQFTFTMRSDRHPLPTIDPALPAASQKEERARFPTTTSFTVDLPPGYKQHGTVFDRFGLMNAMKAGGFAKIYFDDVTIDSQKFDFVKDPGWLAVGNRGQYEDREQVGAHNFGFSAQTSHAGGKAGEMGGDFWRSGKYAFVGDRVGPFTFDQPLSARGRVTMLVGGPDADMMLGWFGRGAGDKSPHEAGHFLGIAVGGPTRVGHYFAPSVTGGKGRRGKVDSAPLLQPGQAYEWTLTYDPTAAAGRGEMKVTLGAESVTLTLPPGLRAEGATLDRFGLFTSQTGGQMVRLYLDDLTYTARAK